MIRERLDAEREEARKLLAQMRPRLMRRRLRASPPADEDADAATLRERLETEKTEARDLLTRMRPAEVASRAAPPAPSPLVLFAACLVLGIALAKLLDWRGHAHPSL